MDFIFCFQQHLTLLIFTGLDGLVDDTGCFFLRAANFLFSDALTIYGADEEKHTGADQKAQNGQDHMPNVHNLRTHLLIFVVPERRMSLRQNEK